jgi:orotidine-5'-phosphate decarboxylase
MPPQGDPLIVALDVADKGRALQLARALRGEAATLKVGLELYACVGPEIIDELTELGFSVFADLKLHDIPNTVGGAVRGLARRGVRMLTVHASGGREMMREAARSAREEATALGQAPPLVLGVTLLTSLGQDYLDCMGWGKTVEEHVRGLAVMAMESGLDGVVASALEVESLRMALGPGAVIVTPGIRLPGEPSHDQKRTIDPASAISRGSDYLVVGRSVIDDKEPRLALKAVRRAAGLEVP